MGISIVIPNLRAGGAEKVSVNLANYWSNSGYDVEFVLMNSDGEFLTKLLSSVSVISLKSARISCSFIPLLRYFKRCHPCVTLVHMWPLTSVTVLAWLLAGKPGKLYICEHTLLSLHARLDLKLSLTIVRLITSFTYPLANGIVAVSSGVANDLSTLTGIKEKSIQVIHNPVVTPCTARRRSKINSFSRSRLWNGEFRTCLVSVGSLKKTKNFSLLIEAFSKVSNQLDAGLVILGEGEERLDLELLVEQLNLQDRVYLPGYHNEPELWLSNADLFVLSSDLEGLPTVLIEALAFGLPIVSTNCQYGPKEILGSGRYGILVPVKNSSALANGILDSLSRAWNISELQCRASHFSIKSQSDKYLQYFEIAPPSPRSLDSRKTSLSFHVSL